MTDRQLRKVATGFRAGLLGRRSPDLMCFAVCAPLQGYLSALGVETDLIEAQFRDVNHVWLRLEDGRILDPTADQFGLEPIYIGRLPLLYATRQARLVVVMADLLGAAVAVPTRKAG